MNGSRRCSRHWVIQTIQLLFSLLLIKRPKPSSLAASRTANIWSISCLSFSCNALVERSDANSVIQAALDLANGLLEEEEAFSLETVERWRTSQVAQAETPAQPPVQAIPSQPKEVPRLQRIEEPLAQMAGTVEQSRHLLREFEAQLPTLRQQLTAKQGWFEVFFVPKRR